MKRLDDFIFERSGNFGIISAILLPILIGVGGIAVDVSNLLLTKQTMQGYADAAALAATSALASQDITEQQAKDLATNYVTGQTANEGHPITPQVNVATTLGLNNSKTFTVDVAFSDTVSLSPLMSLLNLTSATVSVGSHSTSSRGQTNALSMFLVLDRSGSMISSIASVKSTTTACNYYYMPTLTSVINGGSKLPCYYQRIEALKMATDALFATFLAVDPNSTLIRTGAVSYNSQKQTETTMTWGWSQAHTYITSLTPTGGTSSSGAFKVALDALSSPTEAAAHQVKSGLVPIKAIVFMTDGENTVSSDDTNTLAYCASAKSQGMTVYAIAFSASDQGRNLLSKCASGPSTFFYVENATDITNAFKSIGQVATTGLPRLTQ